VRATRLEHSTISDGGPFSATTLTRLYHLGAPGGGALSIQINRDGSSGAGHCNITLSGYLIDPNL